MQIADMFRFAAHHFMGASKWGVHLTDIVLASGKVYSGDKSVVTDSGTYRPIVLDFSDRDGFKRLAEIRQSIADGTFEDYLELVFLPLYGKETGRLRVELAENTIRLQTELYHAKKISSRLLGASLIMANKMIDKKRLREIWEKIKMLDILEIAHEEGEKKGIEKGEVKGEAKGSRNMLKELIIEKYDEIPERVFEKINGIEKIDILKTLFKKALKCETIDQFEKNLQLY